MTALPYERRSTHTIQRHVLPQRVTSLCKELTRNAYKFLSRKPSGKSLYLYSGKFILASITLRNFIDMSKERIASIFRVENKWALLLLNCLLSLRMTLYMEEVRSSETSVTSRKTVLLQPTIYLPFQKSVSIVLSLSPSPTANRTVYYISADTSNL
jgi:hypothetical protein